MFNQFNEPNQSEEVFNRPVHLNKNPIGYTQSRIEQLLAGATPRSAKEAATRQALLLERKKNSMRPPSIPKPQPIPITKPQPIPVPKPQPSPVPKPQPAGGVGSPFSMQSLGVNPTEIDPRAGPNFDFSAWWDKVAGNVLARETPTSKLDFLRSALSIIDSYIENVPRDPSGGVVTLRNYEDHNLLPSIYIKPYIIEAIKKHSSANMPPAWS